MVFSPVSSGIAKPFCRDTSQAVCPFNIKFAQELKVPEFAAREVIASKVARTFARDVLALTQEEFSDAFEGSPMKRAKLRGLQRNAVVVLGNAGDPSALPSLIAALSDSEPLVREHAAWALGEIVSDEATASLLSRTEGEEGDPRALAALRSAISRLAG